MNRCVLGRFIKNIIIGLFNIAGVVTVMALVAAGILNFPTPLGIILSGLFDLMLFMAVVLLIGGIWAVFLFMCLHKAVEECGE